MKIKLMRILDFWIGIPLCFFFGLFGKIFTVFVKAPKDPSNQIRKIAYIKLSEMGSTVLAYSLFKEIKNKYPSSEQYFITFEKNRDIFKLLGNIIPEQNIFTIRDDSLGHFVADSVSVLKTLRRIGLDVIIDLEFFSRFTAIFAFLSSASKRVGFYKYSFEGLYRGDLLTHKIQPNPLLHVSKLYLSLVQVLEKKQKITPEFQINIKDEDIYLPSYSKNLKISDDIKQRLKHAGIDQDNKVVLLNPGEGMLPLREWPLENFVTLIETLLEDPKNWVILIGASSLNQKDQQLHARINNRRCINWTGQTSLLELIELFGLCNVLVVNDCGLAHLASVTQIKKFIIFGPETPQVFSPLGDNNWIFYSRFPCSPCLSAMNHRKSYCALNNCLTCIEPSKVYSAIRENL